MKFVFVLIIALSILVGVNGHGFMSNPKARNVISRTDHYCPHCFNGGGTGNVAANSNGVWPAVETEETSKRHGLCGDPAGQDDHMVGGKSYNGNTVGTYTSGGTIDIDVGVTAHHNGHFEFYLCNKDDLVDPSGPITQDCLNKHPLKRTEGFPSTNPIDPKYPTRYYLDPKCSLSTEFFADAAVTGWKVPTMRFDLPDIECEHCVLQFYWVTANSCLPPGYAEYSFPTTHSECSGDGGSSGWWAPHLGPCTSSYPEEFWNCADIKLVRDGKTSSPLASPTTSAPVPKTAKPTQKPTQKNVSPTNQPTDEDEEEDNNDSGNFVEKHGKLSLDGVQLVGSNGEPVHLKGMSSHGIHWFSNCYTKESIQHLRDEWNINLFRIAMYIGEGGYASQKETLRKRVEDMVSWCEELGIYVMIDWHVLTPGDPNAWLDGEGASTGLAIDWWKDMATMYKDKDHVLYEIANEPNNVDWPTVKKHHDAVIQAIRSIDKQTIIIAGTTTWSQDIHLAAANPVSNPYNVMYGFHFYAGTHESLLQRVREYAPQIPIFSTEWGTSQASGDGGPYLDVAEKFLDAFEELSISWAQWSFADKSEVSAALKPGACSRKAWSDTSTSGAFVKEYLKRTEKKEKEPTPNPTPKPTKKNEKPTRNPTKKPTTKNNMKGCSDTPVAFEVVNDWNSGYQGGIAITNLLGVEITSWSLSFSLPVDVEFESGWEGVFEENNGNILVTPESWQMSIKADGVISPGFGLKGFGERSVTDVKFMANGVTYNCEEGDDATSSPTKKITPKPTAKPTKKNTVKPTAKPTLKPNDDKNSCETYTKKKKCQKNGCKWNKKNIVKCSTKTNSNDSNDNNNDNNENECTLKKNKKKCYKAGCQWKKKKCI